MEPCCTFTLKSKVVWPVESDEKCACKSVERCESRRVIQTKVCELLEKEEKEKKKKEQKKGKKKEGKEEKSEGSLFGNQKGLATFGASGGKLRPEHLAGSILVSLEGGHVVKLIFEPGHGFSMAHMCWMWLNSFDPQDARIGEETMKDAQDWKDGDELELAKFMLVVRFANLLERDVLPNLRKDYKQATKCMNSLRGIPEFKLAIRRGSDPSRGPLECRFSSLTFDLPENRLLKAACHVVFRMTASSGKKLLQEQRSRLADLESLLFGSVTLMELSEARELMRSPFLFHRGNHHYKASVRLAHVLLDGARFEKRDGDCAGFLLTTYHVFESYLGVVLEKSLRKMQESSEELRQFKVEKNKATETKEIWSSASGAKTTLESKQEPDFTIRSKDRVLAVIDAKFSTFFLESKEKSEDYKKHAFRAHRWQILSYMLHTSSAAKTFGALVYAQGESFDQVDIKVAGTTTQRFAVHCAKSYGSVISWGALEQKMANLCKNIIKSALEWAKEGAPKPMNDHEKVN